MNIAWHDLVGTVGVVLVISAYFLSQFGYWRVDSASFPLANGVGALGILISLSFDFNLSAFLVEAAWLLISIVALIRLTLNHQRPTDSGSMPPPPPEDG